MAKYTDSLRGYSFTIHQRDDFVCRYCGLDGKASFASWLSLSWDHLFPKGHPKRDDSVYIVTACLFCNAADNHYFRHAETRGISLEDKTPEELVAQRTPYVLKTRQNYEQFWHEQVQNMVAHVSDAN